MVLQDTWLFEGTILENIQYGSDDKTKMIKKQLNCTNHHFIESLPDGYDLTL
jgi:ATP-binding cassette, subfamily B, multidrug efflux pump